VLSRLAEIQNKGYLLSEDVNYVAQHSRLADGTYSIIAGAIINRNKEESIKAWADREKEVNGYFEQFAKIANSPDERAWVAKAKEYNTQIENLVNNQLFPLIFNSENTAAFEDIAKIDAQIDVPVVEMKKVLLQLIDSIVQENKEGDVYFDTEGTKSKEISIIILVVLVLLLAIFGVYITTNIKGILNRIFNEIKALTDAAVNGKLNTRSETEKVNFEFRPIAVGINQTLDALIGPLNVAAEYIDRISKGNIPSKITDNYRGDFNEIKNNLNQCIDAVNLLVVDTGALAKAAVEGKLTTRANASKHEGDFGKIVEGVNKTLDSLVGFIDNMPVPAMIIDRDFTIQYMNENGARLDNKSGKQLVGSKCYDHFKTKDCRTPRCACSQSLMTGQLAKSETTANPGSFELEISYNAIPVKDEKGSIIGAFEVVADQTAIKQAMRKVEKIGAYQNNEALKVTEGLGRLANGDLDITINTEEADNDTYETKRMFDDINNNLNSIVNAFKDITEKAKLVASGDLTVELKMRSEKDELIKSLQDMVKSVAEVVEQVQSAADNIASASQEMSSTAQQISQGATEQASSAEEVSSSMEQMSSNIQQSKDNSVQTEKISLNAAKGMEKVATSAQESLGSIKKIAEKITIIGDIAFQTNILALNAAVEAARAGEHGRGFAVVAAEVRKLAERSKIAAEEINILSKRSVEVTEEAGKLMQSIIPEVEKTARLVQEITAASIEQDTGAAQINNALTQLSQVTQQNTAGAEEMAASTEQLNSQAEQLMDLVSFFVVDNREAKKKTAFQKKSQDQQKSTFIHSNPMSSKTKGVKLNMRGKDDPNYESF